MQNIAFSPALIIGASGGIGFAMLQQLLNAKQTVFASSRDTASLLEKISPLSTEDQTNLTVIEMDLSQQDSIEQGFREIRKKTEHLRLLVNCSGLLHDDHLKPEKRIEDAEQENLLNAFTINSIAPLLIARYAMPLLQHDANSILANISARVGSISDNRLGGWYAYRASKAAQNMITKNLAIEFVRRSPQTICVGLHPGTVDTDLSKPFQANLKPNQLKTADDSAVHLLNVISQLKPEDSGKIFAWDGEEILP